MKFIYRFNAMSTPCEVTLVAPTKAGGDAAAQAVLEETARLERKYSYYRDDSLLSHINRREAEAIDEETKNLLSRAAQYCSATNGRFDVTAAALKHLYARQLDLEALERKKAELQPYVGCSRFTIKKGRIRFDNPYTRIDLGGVVKEYAVDRAVTVLKRHKIDSALVNFGGDVYALGCREDGSRWRIGITDPNDKTRRLGSIELEDEALTTSASYERTTRIEGKSFSHIVGSEEGASPLSVTVVSHNCMESGVFSTAMMIDPTVPSSHYRLVVDASGKVSEAGGSRLIRRDEAVI